jgi:predicted nucleic acid-binding protein
VIRVVVDPGVFISALIGTRGAAPDIVVRAFIDERTRREYVERVRRHAAVVEDPADVPKVTRDRHDDDLVALALHEGVDAIVSGDRDLLAAGLDAPAIWSPRQAADRIAGE